MKEPLVCPDGCLVPARHLDAFLPLLATAAQVKTGTHSASTAFCRFWTLPPRFKLLSAGSHAPQPKANFASPNPVLNRKLLFLKELVVSRSYSDSLLLFRPL
jgi:hypothetical protein